MKPKTLVKPAIALLAGLGFTLQANAGIPVIDGANVTINQVTSMESVAQTLKQVEEYKMQIDQYQTQLSQWAKQGQQYENMLQNTVAPATYWWDQAQSTINKLTNATDTLAQYKQQAGSLDSYLGKFQDLDYYKNSPCFSNSGCSDADRAALQASQQLASQSQKKANDALFHGLDLQQENIKKDSARLQSIQQSAEGAKGQMEALGYANQLASQQSNQLLQLRSLLITQQNALAAQQQAAANKEAMQQAASDKFWTISSPDTSQDKGFTP